MNDGWQAVASFESNAATGRLRREKLLEEIVTAEKSMLPSQNARTMALLAHLSGFVLPMIGPLLVWILQQNEEDPFIVDQCKEALNFQITMTVAATVASFATAVLVGCLVLPLVVVAAILFPVLAAVESYQGRAYRYPFTVRLVQ